VKLYDSQDHEFDCELRSFNGTPIWIYTMYRRHGSNEYHTEHYSEDHSELRNYKATCPNYNAEFDPESHSFNAATAHLAVICDKSSAVQ